MNKVGDNITARPGDWKFSGSTVNEFEEHVKKSVPLYLEGHDLICDLAEFFIQDNSTIYEIGSSTGTLTSKLATKFSHKNELNFIGVEIEQDMVNKAYENIKNNSQKDRIEFLCEDVSKVEFLPSDLIVSYYSVQFIKPSVRQILIDKIFNSLKWGGAFIMFEKTRGSDARFQDILTTLYTDYKLRKGYSPEDIVSKTRSLKGVLEPFSSQGNIELLERAGFKDINVVQKYICFEGFIAIK